MGFNKKSKNKSTPKVINLQQRVREQNDKKVRDYILKHTKSF